MGVGRGTLLSRTGGEAGRAQLAVPEALVQAREVDGVVEQAVRSPLERAGEELARQVDGQQLATGFECLVRRPADTSVITQAPRRSAV
jgi:hypothetical protein